jgi:NAD(P)-dependent dehydrogenase (short-subunit alcohol dehydrogenase family)
MKLKDQVAVITGAGRNIGEETAKLMASEGAKIAVVDMDKSRGDKVAADIVASGGDAAGFVADISSESDVQRLIKEIDARFGRIDILVNNAAISDNKTIFTITKADWDKVLAVTLTGTFLMCQNVAKLMVDKKIAGKIINVGSTSGFFGRSRALAYTTAKGGVANFTRSLAVQLAKYNIRVNAIIPNKIGSPVGKDEFDPTRPVVNLVNRPGVPDDLAQAVLFMASKESSFIAGALLFVDGGMSAMMVGDHD